MIPVYSDGNFNKLNKISVFADGNHFEDCEIEYTTYTTTNEVGYSTPKIVSYTDPTTNKKKSTKCTQSSKSLNCQENPINSIYGVIQIASE